MGGMTGLTVLRDFLLAGCTAAVVSVSLAVAEEPHGPARVIDGDTLDVAGRRFDLAGIDAPEPAQTCEWPNKRIACGEIAAGALKDLTTAVAVVCTPLSPVTGEAATPAHCRAGGYDLGWNMIYTGWAVAEPDAPPAYRAAQAEAREAGRGMWKGRFDPPSVWRDKVGSGD